MFDFPIHFPGIDNSDPQQVLEYIKSHPELKQMYSADTIDKWIRLLEEHVKYSNGEVSANDLLGIYGNLGGSMSPETEKWLDNQIANEKAEQQQNFEISARDTSLLSSGQQLQQLGLSSSGVLQTGGASAGVQGSMAATNMHSAASLRQQAKINKFNQQMGLAKSLIGAASSMASSGIYGAAIGAVKHSAQSIAGAAAHSGLNALKATNSKAIESVKLPRNTTGMDSQLKKDPYYSLFY